MSDIAGFMLFMDAFPKDNYREMRAAVLDSLGELTPEFEKVMDGYFNTLDYDFVGTQIISLAVRREYRRQHVAESMLATLDPHKDYSLACVKDNIPARNLYEKMGFTLLYEYPGYPGIPCVELVKKGGPT